MTRIVKPQVATTPAAVSAVPAAAAVAKAVEPAGQKASADSFERVDASPAPGALGGTSAVGGGSRSPVGPATGSPHTAFGHLADRLARTEAFRQLAGVKEMVEALRAVPGLAAAEPSLLSPLGIDPGSRGGHGPLGRIGDLPPTSPAAAYENPLGDLGLSMPDNRDQAPPSLVGPPSADPRSWMGGAAGQGYVPPPLPRLPEGQPAGRTTTVDGEGNRSTTTLFEARGVPTGAVTSTSHADGSRSLTVARIEEDGSVTATFTHYDANGKKTDSETFNLPAEGADRLYDPDNGPVDPAVAAAVRHYDHSKKPEPPVVTWVNPGRDPNPQPLTGPQIQPGSDLATDPREDLLELPMTVADARDLQTRLRRGVGPGAAGGGQGDE